MIVKMRNIVEARDALLTLSKQRLPIKLSYDVSKLIKKANSLLDHLTQTRKEIIDRTTPDGNMTPEINQTIMDELNTVLDTEVEMFVNKIDLRNLSGLEMSPLEVITLEPFCVFEDEQVE